MAHFNKLKYNRDLLNGHAWSGYQHERLSELGTGAQQGIYRAFLSEFIQPAQSCDYPLFDLAFCPTIFNDLQVGVTAFGFLAKEHGVSVVDTITLKH